MAWVFVLVVPSDHQLTLRIGFRCDQERSKISGRSSSRSTAPRDAFSMRTAHSGRKEADWCIHWFTSTGDAPIASASFLWFPKNCAALIKTSLFTHPACLRPQRPTLASPSVRPLGLHIISPALTMSYLLHYSAFELSSSDLFRCLQSSILLG